jgi:uncharacterized protein YecE (DUF72 family)
MRREDRRCGVAVNQQIIRVGTVGFPISKKNLFNRVDVIELSDTFNAMPKEKTGRKLREETPPRAMFTMQLPKFLFSAPVQQAQLPGNAEGYGEFQNTDENRKLFERAVRYADAVEADTLVLITPSDFTPAKPRRDALSSFLGAVDRASKKLVWQPSGPWEIERAAAFAAEIDAVLAVDPLRDEPSKGPVCYLRLGPFSAMGSRVGNYDLEKIADVVRSFEDATVIFDTEKAFDDAKNLKTVLAEGAFDDEEDEEDAGEYEDDDEDEDEEDLEDNE